MSSEDARFYPCNRRESRILADLPREKNVAYRAARHAGATVTEAVEKITNTPEEFAELYGTEAKDDLGY